ncbi:hypothetical protein JW935_20055 [candidate division KSB1 bacterium]|nr:hypothetical protein [candidate division KSB1 bacterium]
MKKNGNIKIFLLLGVLISLAGNGSAHGRQLWRLETRLQALYENDSNVAESLNHSLAANSTRFLINPAIQRAGDRLNLSLQYHGGLQLYQQITAENKLVNELNVRAAWRINSSVLAGIKGFGRLKLFLNRNMDYLWDRMGPFVSLHGRRCGLQLGYTLEGVDYARMDYFDCVSDFYDLQFYCNLRQNLQISPAFTLGKAVTNRPAYDRVADLFNWLKKNEQQQDQIRIYAVQMDWMWRGLLVNTSYGFEDLASNSFGFSYTKHFLTLMTAKSIHSVLLRAFASLQKKTYRDDMRPFWPLELDTEIEESNFFVFDVSKDLTSKTILMLRLAYYQNESPWANLYYEKMLIHLGFEFRF